MTVVTRNFPWIKTKDRWYEVDYMEVYPDGSSLYKTKDGAWIPNEEILEYMDEEEVPVDAE